MIMGNFYNDVTCNVCGKPRGAKSGTDHSKCSKINQAKYATTKRPASRTKVLNPRQLCYIADIIKDK